MMRTGSRLFLLFLLPLLLLPGCSGSGVGDGIDEGFASPGMECRPFVRWWWNGDRVDDAELGRELELLKAAGIGGVEINPIITPWGADTTGTRALRISSPEWVDRLKFTFDQASSLGMRCDLLLGSGWPFGAETLPMEERASVVLLNAFPVAPGRFSTSVNELCRAIDPGVTVPNPERRFSFMDVLLVPNPVNSVNDAVDVSTCVRNDSLTVDVPEGDYYLYVVMRCDSFASVINGAPGASGSILNHLDRDAVLKYLDSQADPIESRIGPLSGYLRSFFVDSMELEGCNWCDDLPEEFRRRRGYDLTPWLPFILFKVGRLGEVVDYSYGARKSEDFERRLRRVRLDYELTKAELFDERFSQPFASWCRSKGVLSRAQAYGRGFFPLESSLRCDIPEGESWTTNWLRHRLGEEMGDEDYRRGRGYTMINKYVSSAANINGRRIVSSEEMTNTYRVFSTSLELLKIGSDMGAFSGTTLPVWSGYNYSPPQAAFPGWVQYGSYSNEANPWWPYFRCLNDYRARVSEVLTHADMVTDIAILPANLDLWAELGVQTDPFPWYLNVPYTSLLWEAIHKNGGGADYLSDGVLASARVRRGKLCVGCRSYGVVFLPEVKTLSLGAMDVLGRFVRGGGRVFCIGCLPSQCLEGGPDGWMDGRVKDMVSELCTRYPERFVLLEKAEDDAWLEWYRVQMERFGLPRHVSVSKPDRFLLQNLYRTDGGSSFFLFSNVSLSREIATGFVFPPEVAGGKPALLYDPDSGCRYLMPGSVGADGSFSCELRLGPSQTVFLALGRPSSSYVEELWDPSPSSVSTICEITTWDITLDNPRVPGETVFFSSPLADLKDAAPGFMGVADYKAVVSLDSVPEGRVFLDLGRVCEIAELYVNGKPAGLRWWGDAVFDVTGLLVAGDNAVEVRVSTLIANYMLTMPDNPVVKRFMLGRKQQPPVSAGLLGPVRLLN